MNFAELGIEENLVVHQDGAAVVQYFEELLKSLNINAAGRANKLPLQPVSLLLLDINMPILTGIEVMQKVEAMFQKMNAEYQNDVLHGGNTKVVLRPMICYYSQHDRYTMK